MYLVQQCMKIACAHFTMTFIAGWARFRFLAIHSSRVQKLREPPDHAEIAIRCHGADPRCSCGFHSLHVIRAQSEGIKRPEMRRFPRRPSAKKTPDPSWTEGGTWRAPWCQDGFLFWRSGTIFMHKENPPCTSHLIIIADVRNTRKSFTYNR